MRAIRKVILMIWFCAILAVLSFVYLIVAMLRPEWFSN
ncbi:MAG: potassium-transporting ATPase subunit F [Phycisphaerales bacterium]|nr:potassium-transporting ATPase subunit F [Phycisphaerales bacterium]